MKKRRRKQRSSTLDSPDSGLVVKKRKAKRRTLDPRVLSRDNANLERERDAMARQLQESIRANQKLVADAKDFARFKLNEQVLEKVEDLGADVGSLVLEAITERELRANENRNENSIARAVKLVQLTLWMGGNQRGNSTEWTFSVEARASAAVAACTNLLSYWVCADRARTTQLLNELRDRVAWWEVAERNRKAADIRRRS